MRAVIPEGHDRPREKLARAGVAALGDVELLALVLGHGAAGRTALELAGELLRDVGGVHAVTKASMDRLTRLPGVGAAQASRIIAAIELGRRTLLVSPQARLPLRSPEIVGTFLLPRFGAHATERFGALLLDSRHRLLRVHIVSEGGLDAAMAVPQPDARGSRAHTAAHRRR
jgi:DNA repair protein RadC